MTKQERIEKTKNGKIFTPWDAALYGALAVALAVLLAVSLTRRPGGSALVYIDNALFAEYPLSVNAEYPLSSADGKYSLTLHIEDGRVFVTGADCPDRVCERGGAYRAHQTVVCLPARIVIRIAGSRSGLDGEI